MIHRFFFFKTFAKSEKCDLQSVRPLGLFAAATLPRNAY